MVKKRVMSLGFQAEMAGVVECRVDPSTAVGSPWERGVMEEVVLGTWHHGICVSVGVGKAWLC